MKPQYSKGDRVISTFTVKRTLHTVTAVKTGMRSETGVCYQVDPPVTTRDAWIDQNWFLGYGGILAATKTERSREHENS